MSTYSNHINEATSRIEKECRDIRECASKLEESAPSTSSNIPMDKIAWCGRAFEYMIEYLLPEQQGIWKQRRDAVLAQLRHR